MIGLFAPLMLLAALPTAGPRRFLLAIGQNVGDPTETTLRYAESDARQVVRAFEELGGVRSVDVTLVLDATTVSVKDALSRLSSTLAREARASDQLFVFVSGHADEGELHLKGGRFRVADLRDFAQRAPVGVAVLLLDSCRSGATTRAKGLRALPTLVSAYDPGRVKGRVIITSSGADESAQESDTVQGSYFTTHWVAAMRGLGDASGDGRVTLQEAYTYAFQRTVDSTFSTGGGVQHPSFSMQLKGEGELVVSEPGRATAQLVIDAPAPGEYLIQSDDGTRVLSHFHKPNGPARVAMPPGAYRVRARDESGVREGRVELTATGPSTLRDEALRPVGPVAAVAKGSARPPPPSFALSVFGSVTQGTFAGLTPLGGAGLRAAGELPGAIALGTPVWVGEATWVVGRSSTTVPLAHREASGALGLGLAWRAGRTSLTASLQGGALWVRQSEAPLVAERDAWAPQVQASVEGRLRLRGPWALALSGWGGPTWIRAQGGTSTRLRAGAGLGVAFDR